jgi:hypothetical protein
MARPLRIQCLGGLYQVTARGNERRAIFRDIRDRRHFWSSWGELPERFGTCVHGWVLMDNAEEVRSGSFVVEWLGRALSKRSKRFTAAVGGVSRPLRRLGSGRGAVSGPAAGPAQAAGTGAVNGSGGRRKGQWNSEFRVGTADCVFRIWQQSTARRLFRRGPTVQSAEAWAGLSESRRPCIRTPRRCACPACAYTTSTRRGDNGAPQLPVAGSRRHRL